MRKVIWQGKPPVSVKARQASTKVISWPLSSATPRPTIRLPVAASTIRGSKGGRLPQIERVGRLHIVMAVKQDMRHVGTRGLGLSDDHRMACRLRTDASKPRLVQLVGEPFGRLGAIARDRRDRSKPRGFQRA